jgi:simple sugar transport system ATP-binding protein
VRGLTKRFGGIVANDGVNLRVQAGSIHGLIGENGAGKSTAMKLLYGIYRPDAGEILIDGQARKWRSPSDAIAAGLGMVHQHFMLAGPYTALDNVLLGAEPTRWGIMQRSTAQTRLDKLAEQYGLQVDWDRSVEEMPVGAQQRIEILKLLYRDAKVLILDEPTSVLTPQETSRLFSNLRKLRDEGKTIIVVTHKLKEVMSATDRVTVFRGGKVVHDAETSRTNPQELANAMVGRKVALDMQVSPANPSTEPALEVARLSLVGASGTRHRLSDVSFCVRRGEILGIAGVEGNGQSELLQAILHPREARCRTSGTVRVLGQDVTNWTTTRIRELGVAFVPEDRHLEGLLLNRTTLDNFVLGLERSQDFSRFGFLRGQRISAIVSQEIEEYDIRPRDLRATAGGLSGGNQQKLILAREFHRRPKLVLAAQPTRGVDVGGIEFIHQRIVRARDAGAGILLISSELDEILTLSDRILVMYEGSIAAEFKRREVSEQELGLKMGGHS